MKIVDRKKLRRKWFSGESTGHRGQSVNFMERDVYEMNGYLRSDGQKPQAGRHADGLTTVTINLGTK